MWKRENHKDITKRENDVRNALKNPQPVTTTPASSKTTKHSEGLDVSIGDRWSIVGGTGSGKTWFARELISQYITATDGTIPIYILDTKISGDFNGLIRKGLARVVRGNNPPAPFTPRPATKLKKAIPPVLIWQPEYDDLDVYNQFFQGIYQVRQPGIIYIDELGSITNPRATVFPRYYDILLKQGRGLNIGMISSTQSSSYIPFNLLRQTTHVVRMHLNNPNDAKKLADVMGRKAEQEPTDQHGLWYRNVSKPVRSNPPIYYNSMQDFFNLD